MMLARHGTDLREASPGAKDARCPLCDSPVIAKCGEINVWHWAHRSADCDPWSEPMSAWHLSWQQLVPVERREVTIGNHRADIVTPRGVVVEVQHSHISAEEILERETHYRLVVWIFDTRDAYDGDRFHLWAPTDAREPTWRRFRWRYARRTIAACDGPVYFDLGDRLLLVQRFDTADGPLSGWGHLWTREQVAAALNEPYQQPRRQLEREAM